MSTASNRRYWRTQAERYKRERDEARTERDVAYARADELRYEVRYWIKIVNLGGDPGAHWTSGEPKEEHPWEVEQ